MEFTREPIVETIITSKDGCKLVVRNSKGAGQEEYFVDAVEIVTFGGATFFRSLEKPKAFMVPVTDYEVLEVRDSRMVLKNVNFDKIKIGGGREASFKGGEPEQKGRPPAKTNLREEEGKPSQEAKQDVKVDRKKDRRRHHRRKRGREELSKEKAQREEGEELLSPSDYPSLLPPPDSLISDTLGMKRQGSESFNNSFNENVESFGNAPSPKEKEVEGGNPSFFRGESSPPQEESFPEQSPFEGGSSHKKNFDRSDKDREVHQLGEESSEKRLDIGPAFFPGSTDENASSEQEDS